jgi:hypothetical protein
MGKINFMSTIVAYNRSTGEQDQVRFGDALDVRIDIQGNGFDTGYKAGVEYLAPALTNLYEAMAFLHSHTSFWGREENSPVIAIPDFLSGWGWFNPDYLGPDEIDGLIYGFENGPHVIITLVARPKISF